MKRSSKIALTLIASATLTSCGGSGSTQDTRRELYSSIEDCKEDWGSDDRCEPHPRGSGYYGPHYIYTGGRPLFFPTGSNTPQTLDTGKFSQFSEGTPSPRSAGTTMAKFDTSAKALSTGSNYHSSAFRSTASTSAHSSVSRGGFGSSGSAHGSGS